MTDIFCLCSLIVCTGTFFLELVITSSFRYSSMLAENLVNPPSLCKPSYLCNAETNPSSSARRGGESDNGSHLDIPATDADYDLQSSKESTAEEKVLRSMTLDMTAHL
ncbi:uncharacterized protein LOC121794082 isoform X2 [Salvia splendens]|uniref:uncharacterized protein LOC121794082 isoform X2 n=1 Tax=Salvia splendens TaxID=180675 RepID=UPI001C25562B|nr:uncharacterized protein LOC121794082 isoform X2 [Salvia splendens]